MSVDRVASGRMPIISLIEPCNNSIEALMMNAEITTPTYASRLIFVKIKISAAAKTEVESVASKSASEPEAIRVSEFTRLPIERT